MSSNQENDCQKLRHIFNSIDNLITPTDSVLSVEDTPADWLDNLLKEKLLQSGLELGPEEDIRWNYVGQCLKILTDLKSVLNDLGSHQSSGSSTSDAPTLSPDALSVSQQQKISSILQLVVALGVVPFLLPGVGLPPEKRSKFLQYLLQTGKEHPILEKYNRLVHVSNCLGDVMSNKNLSQIIITRHVGDVLAAYIQLSYAPLKKPTEASPSDENVDKSEFVMTQELFNRFTQDQKHFEARLKSLIEKVYPPLIVKYLLLLQSSGAGERVKPAPKSVNKVRSPTPKWLQAACGKLLSDRLVQKDGVLNVLRGVLDLGGDSSDPQKYHLIAQVIANPPSSGSYADLESYFQLISPQILKLLSMEDNTDTKTYHMIAAACARSLTERSLILTRRYLLGSLMEPLTKLCAPEIEGATSQVVVSEAELDKCIEKLHLLFVIGNDPSLVFVGHLRPIMLALLELHCQITFGVSHLKQNVEQLVKSYLQKSCLSLSLKTLRAFAFAESADDDQLKPMNSAKFSFVPGESGGTQVIQKGVLKEKRRDRDENEENEENEVDDGEGEESPSFYVADDEKSIAVVDLLLESKDKSLGVEFFLSLLKDLTEMMCSDFNFDVEEELSVVAEGKPSEDTCDRLLALERDLDNTMLRLRRQLMVIRLLGLLSEDEKLRSALMRFPDKLIEFLSLTLHRGALMCNTRPVEDSFQCTGLEVQSLTTALSLMSYLVVQKNVRTSDWKALQGSLEDLAILSEKHKDVNVRKMSEKLRNVIATHGAVLMETEAMRGKTDKINKLNAELHMKMDQMKILIEEENARIDAAKLESDRVAVDENVVGDKVVDKKLVEVIADICHDAENVPKLVQNFEAKTLDEKSIREETEKQNVDSSPKTVTEIDEKVDEETMCYLSALAYIEDDEIPIKGHGLIVLTNLVKAKDEETINNIETVLNIFQQNLTHDDTYVYLQSIMGLAECSNYYPDSVINRLTTEFAHLDDKKFGGETGIEIRTKIGEALVRITRLLGEMTAAHKNKLLNPFLAQLGHPDPLVRASSLSNLGEVCKNLRFAIGGLASEIFETLNRILQLDKSLEVRRAAVLVITLILQGLGGDVFRVLESVLRDIWRTLIALRNNEHDDVMLTHVGLAISEVDSIVKKLFQPDRQNTKTIYVLDQPPSPF